MGQWRRFSAFVTKDSNPAPAIRHALQFTRAFLTQHSCDARLKVKLAILIEELVTNSLRHGGQSQDLALSLLLKSVGDGFQIEMKDDGPAFDPLAAPSNTGPDPITGGGVGLAIVNAWGEDATYSRASGNNLLRLALR